MVYRRFLIFAILLVLMPAAWANHPLGVSSKIAIAQRQAGGRLHAPLRDSSCYQAFIRIQDESVLEQLQLAGIVVNGQFDGYVTAQVPVNAMNDLVEIAGVRHISLARHLDLCNDSARYFSRVNDLHAGYNQVTAFKGRGVVIGVIDTGIDFNHINLCDADGRSRVRAVYLPCDSTGSAPVVDGYPLPGSCYETPDEIAGLTADCTSASHGTHTTGTAAGSYLPNGMYGVAPEADIVVCGMAESELNDVNIANGIKYIFDYADRHHQPCVINMSIGSNEGPNDGTSPLCRVFESLCGPGRICVLAAGNDGDAPICFHKSLMGRGDTVTTFLRNQWGGLQREGYVSMWSDGCQIHKTRVVIVNRNSGMLEYASPLIGMLPEDSVYCLSSETDSAFAQYYTGEMIFSSAFEPSSAADETSLDDEPSRYHSFWVFDATSKVAGHLLGLQYVCDEAAELVGWSTKKAYFYTFGFENVTGGSTSGSISDLATSDSVISVGAYCTRYSYVDHNGETHVLTRSNPGDIAYFSSFGPDERGISRPDLCAPGHSLFSSASRYDEHSDRGTWLAEVLAEGTSYPYYVNQGTSMSAPVVTGAIALMLQINPSLSPSAVREIFRQTCIKDGPVLDGDAQRWGSGKLDAVSAINHVIRNTLLQGDVNNDHEVTIADAGALVDILLGNRPKNDAAALVRADVNYDNEIQIGDINQVIDLILK